MDMDILSANFMEESFRLDPLREVFKYMEEEFDPIIEFSPHEEFNLEQIITEAKGEGMLSKIWGFIKKVFRWVSVHLGRLLAAIRKFLFGSPVKEFKPTATELARQAGVYPKSFKAGEIKTDEEAEAAADSLYTNFIKGFQGNRVLIDPAALMRDQHTTAIKGKSIYQAGTRATFVINLILDPTPLDAWFSFFQRLTTDDYLQRMTKQLQARDVRAIDKGILSDISKPSDEIMDQVKIVGSVFKDWMRDNKLTGLANEIYLDIDKLLDFQKRVDQMSQLGDKFDDYHEALNLSLHGTAKKDEYIMTLNQLAWACVELQGGLLALGNGLQGIYQIDPPFFGSISDITLLAKFVEKCIGTGMPGKFIVNNIYKIADTTLIGHPDPDKPIMGFGRLTLLPPGNIVYKVAINGYGIRSNKNDFRVMDAIRQFPDMKIRLAETIKQHNNFVINEMERVYAGSDYQPSREDMNKWVNEFKDRQIQYGVKGFEIKDLKPDAFGKRDKNASGHPFDVYILVDYGMIFRKSEKGYHDKMYEPQPEAIPA